MSSVFARAREWDVDIDRFLNRFLPASPLHGLPTPIARFLGYRKVQRPDVGNVLGAFWSLVGAFCGLAVVAAVFNNTESIYWHHPPALIASFGASAVLEYNAVRSPLGQPRNALFGHTLSAIIGVGISKLFQHHAEYESMKWIAGTISCGVASAVMLLTGTVHPPGGASAVLAATEPAISAMGWYFVGLVMWGTTLMLIVGLVINNIQRQFPVYWWTPLNLKQAKKNDEKTVPNARGGVETRETDGEQQDDESEDIIQISGTEVLLPDDLSLNAEETKMLERLRERLRRRADEKDVEEEQQAGSSSGRSSAECTVVPSRSDAGEEGRSREQV